MGYTIFRHTQIVSKRPLCSSRRALSTWAAPAWWLRVGSTSVWPGETSPTSRVERWRKKTKMDGDVLSLGFICTMCSNNPLQSSFRMLLGCWSPHSPHSSSFNITGYALQSKFVVGRLPTGWSKIASRVTIHLSWFHCENPHFGCLTYLRSYLLGWWNHVKSRTFCPRFMNLTRFS